MYISIFFKKVFMCFNNNVKFISLHVGLYHQNNCGALVQLCQPELKQRYV